MDTGVSTSRGLHCSGSSSVHPCALYPLVMHLRLFVGADDTFASPPFIFPPGVIVPPHQMCVCLTFCPLFLPPRGAGGGDGKSRDGRPPRETEAPAPTQRALPVPPAGVFTCHAHQVNSRQEFLEV